MLFPGRAVFLSDLDSDGDLDAFLAGRKLGVVWWNDGQAAFTKASQHFRYSHRHGVAIGESTVTTGRTYLPPTMPDGTASGSTRATVRFDPGSGREVASG